MITFHWAYLIFIPVLLCLFVIIGSFLKNWNKGNIAEAILQRFALVFFIVCLLAVIGIFGGIFWW